MKAYVQEEKLDGVFASSFNRARSHMNTKPCCFITAWRDSDDSGNKLSNNDKRKRNAQLESDIRASGLTYIKATGGFIENQGTDSERRVTEDTFCVIDNKYPEDRFVSLCIYWCDKYDQDAVLVTMPKYEDNGKVLDITGTYYDGSGSIVMEFSNADMSDVDEFFTSIGGKDFVLSSSSYVITKGYDIRSSVGRRLGSDMFESIYSDMVVR